MDCAKQGDLRGVCPDDRQAPCESRDSDDVPLAGGGRASLGQQPRPDESGEDDGSRLQQRQDLGRLEYRAAPDGLASKALTRHATDVGPPRGRGVPARTQRAKSRQNRGASIPKNKLVLLSPPTNDLESAIVATLAPVDPGVAGSGQYTAIVRDNAGGTGVALVEVYDLDDPLSTISELANISTRGFVD